MVVVPEVGLLDCQRRHAAEMITGFLHFIPVDIVLYDFLIDIFKQSLSLYPMETTKAQRRVGVS